MNTMGVARVDVLCECDGCQKRFGVEVDIATAVSDFYDFDAIVRETVVNGNATYFTWGVRGKATVDRFPLAYQPTVQAGLLLCDVCSQKCDALPEEGDLTRDQVCRALGLPAEQPLEDPLERLQRTLDRFRVSEKDLSDAYVRLRSIIPGALDTPHGPTGEQVWTITENAARNMVKTVENIRGAVEAYYLALDQRENNDIAGIRAFRDIQRILDMHWTQGEMLKKRTERT